MWRYIQKQPFYNNYYRVNPLDCSEYESRQPTGVQECCYSFVLLFFVFYFNQHLSTFRLCLLSSNLSTSFSGAISLGGGLLCVGTSSMSFPCSPYAITFWSLLLSFSEINSRKKNYHFLIGPRIRGWVLHWISRLTWVSHFHIRLNPLTPKIWLLILPCGCYTFPCKLVMRT